MFSILHIKYGYYHVQVSHGCLATGQLWINGLIDKSTLKDFLNAKNEKYYFLHPEHFLPSLTDFVLFDLILYVPSTIFQLYRDGSSWVEPVLS